MNRRTGGSSEPKYIDRPEISEVFADRLEHMFFDGGTVRMEFTVTRTEPSPHNIPGKPIPEPKRWAYTACRVVLAGRGVAEMLNKMMELQAVLLQQGVLEQRTTSPPPAPVTGPGLAQGQAAEPSP